MTIGTLVIPVPSFQAIDGWLGLEKWLPLFRSVLEMGSCYVAQHGLELMGTNGAGRTLGAMIPPCPASNGFIVNGLSK